VVTNKYNVFLVFWKCQESNHYEWVVSLRIVEV